MRRAQQYQNGCIQKEKRSKGPDIWVFRWRERLPNGTQALRKKKIGTVAKYPKQVDAERAVALLRIQINAEQPVSPFITVAELIGHYQKHESGRKSVATNSSYEFYLKNWVVPRWGTARLSEVKPIVVEAWLADIERAPGTKAKIRNLMSALFTHAKRHELFVGDNPIKLVRQSAKRTRVPDALTATELQDLFLQLGQRERVLVLLDVPSGMRVGELLALKWHDIDFEQRTVNICKSIWHNHEGPVKTEESEKLMPLDEQMIAELQAWRAVTPYRADSDWVFASPVMDGKQPYWPENLIRRHIREAAKRRGLKSTSLGTSSVTHSQLCWLRTEKT